MNSAEATTTTKESVIGLELTRKLLLFEYSQSQDAQGQSSTTNRTPRITNEALQAASFLLERFISEARQRALLEAEFDHDKHGYLWTHSQNETKAPSESKRLKFSSQTSTVPSSSSLESNPIPEIQTDHVLKIAAEMLLDYC